ncbi:unnamed protein product, partial [Meganyctiphanes norvegica]
MFPKLSPASTKYSRDMIRSQKRVLRHTSIYVYLLPKLIFISAYRRCPDNDHTLSILHVSSSQNAFYGCVFSIQSLKIGMARNRSHYVIIEGGEIPVYMRISTLIEILLLAQNTMGFSENKLAKKLKGGNPHIYSNITITIFLLSYNTISRGLFFLAEQYILLSRIFDNSLGPPFLQFCWGPHYTATLKFASNMGYYNHPYLYELQSWGPAASQLCEIRPTPPRPLDETPLVMVDREEDLHNMVETLKASSEIAVDLEHHSFRSYQGLSCLMQISTRTQDFIVDPFALRGKLTCLNEVFANPKITKVFHGADFDILWLQRDFGVYVVNMFDTHQAAVILEYPQRSLAALLNKFTQVMADKTYQRADWRIRPLPQDFISYARQDSHYLLFIYDLMRNELIKKGNNLNNLINAVYCRSTDICMKRYEKPIVTPESHLDLYRRSRKFLNSRQMYALQQLYLWRDKIAREQDESVEYVLPKHMMLQMSEILPKEMQGALACCNPIPSLVKTELLTLHNIFRAAREQKLDVVETAISDQAATATTGQKATSHDMAEVMISKHDLCNLEDSKELPTLLKPQETLLGDLFSQHKVQIQLESTSKLFGVKKGKLQIKRNKLLKKTNEYMGAYERYKLYLELKPLIEDEKKKEKHNTTNKERLERVNRVREHFLSLTKNTPKPTPAPNNTNSTETDTSLRVADEDLLDFSGDGRKLQREQYMESKKEETSEHQLVNKEKKKKQPRGNRKGPMVLKAHIKKNQQQKRRSEESNNDIANKKAKKAEEQVELEEKEKKTDDGPDSYSESDDDHNNENNEGQTDGQNKQSFDYGKADYSMFERKKNKKKHGHPQIKEKFKGKHQKSKVMKKSGMKSFTWGNKGAGGAG